MIRFCPTILCLGSQLLALSSSAFIQAGDYPLSEKERQVLTAEFAEALKTRPKPTESNRNAIQVYSKRGDTLFFLGRFKECVEHYQQMVAIDPSIDASHWRLGIALFFADQPQLAAAQFDKYHSFDQVDRENGIWRYLSHYRARGADEAKKELLRYEKDDRQPFPAVYKLFDDSLTAAQALQMITDELPERERDKRLFYTELYVGMHLVVQKKTAEAIKYLKLATSRKWPRDAGFGPNYMWHVGRVQLDCLLLETKSQ